MSDEHHPGLRRVEVDDLLGDLLGRASGALDAHERMRLLLDAVVSTTGDLSLDGVLARIVRLAEALADARYAALGVLAQDGEQRLHTFVHHGLPPGVADGIGDAPRGLGLLGLIIDRPEPLRLHDLSAHAASSGFPANHPPMRSFLGVPVRSRGRVFGNLYLTEKAGGGDFTDDDEEVVVALAAAAGVAIENARLYEEAQRRQRWLEASAEAVTALARDGATAGALDAVVQGCLTAAGADAAWLVLRDESGTPAVVARAGVPNEPEVPPALGSRPVGVLGGRQLVVAVPSPRRGDGALGLAWAPGRSGLDLDHQLPTRHAAQVALALEVAGARDDQERLAVLEDRDRIGRDLHDLVIQRLFAISIGLDAAARRSADDRTVERVGRAVDELDLTIKEIRRTIFALRTPEDAGDVQSRVTRLVERARATLKSRPSLVFEGPVRSVVTDDLAEDVLAVLGEALSNASRHAEARRVEVTLAAGERVTLTVADDGVGLEQGVARSGLASLSRRAEQHGGTLEVRSAPGRGTRLVWSVPRPVGAGHRAT